MCCVGLRYYIHCLSKRRGFSLFPKMWVQASGGFKIDAPATKGASRYRPYREKEKKNLVINIW